MLINQTLDKLDALGLFGMGLGLREQLESNQYLGLSFDERLGLLVDRETEARDSRRLALRLKAARLRQEASVEDIDFRTPRGLDRSVLMSLAQAGWVTAHHNVLVTGPTGCGKTSTLAALIDLINSRNRYHIVTIEDPIEYHYANAQSIVVTRIGFVPLHGAIVS